MDLIDWASISTEEIAAELAKRDDLLDQSGLMCKALWDLRVKLHPVACVDSIPVRRGESGRTEFGFIIRNTGYYTGRLWTIGGVIKYNEFAREALRRHYRETLGVGIEIVSELPDLNEYPQRDPRKHTPFIGCDPHKHSLSKIYLVRLCGDVSFVTTSHGGQEAAGLNWFLPENLPERERFAYEGYDFVYGAVQENRDLVLER
ncbi:MAG: DUF4916 domain-containing protein [Patescibacteria group bacterium]